MAVKVPPVDSRVRDGLQELLPVGELERVDEVPGDSGSLSEVADKRLKEVKDGTNTDSLDVNRQASKNWNTIPYGTRPPFKSPEFAVYFEEVVKTSRTRNEAASRLGYRDAKMVWYHMRKLGVQAPEEWHRRPHLALVSQKSIPEIVIPTTEARSWVASIVQGEGCIQSGYDKDSNYTYLVLDVLMVDPAPIFRLSKYIGLNPPSKPVKNHQWKPIWHKNIAGLRAFRVLHEILPFLVGTKRREAEKAAIFFDPEGDHRGCFRNGDIWSRSDFPLRTKRRGSDPMTHGMAEQIPTANPGIGSFKQKTIPEVIIPNMEDRYWVAALIQGEGCIESFYVAATDCTAILLTLGMTDSAVVFRFSDLVGLPRPAKPRNRSGGKPTWRKSIVSMRAIRVLREITPLLLGDKLREAERALTFFDCDGYHEGCARPTQIWPTSEFPLRKRH